MAFAEGTDVPVERSRAEIERLITRYGCARFMCGWDNDDRKATIAFESKGRRIRFEISIPAADEMVRGPSGRRRPERDVERAKNAEERRRWRALHLVIKAKLEAVQTGITSFEDEFLAYFVMPNGDTLREALLPKLDAALATGKLPPMLGPAK